MKYQVAVKAGSKREDVVENEGILTVHTHKRAQNGEANKDVIRLLADYFGVGKTKIQIIRGETNRQKIIEVDEHL